MKWEVPKTAVVEVEVELSSVVLSLSVVVEVVEEPLSLLLLQEMMVKLKRNKERIMSICLTCFPFGGFRRTQYIPELGGFYKEVGRLWRLSDSVKN